MYTKYFLPMLVLLLSACASLQPLDGEVSTLQEEIRGGEVIAAGDRAAITTRDGALRSILVHSVDDGFVRGYEASHVADGMPQTPPDVDIAIDDIVHLEVAQTETDIPDIDKPYVLYVILFGVVSIVAAYLSIF
jgi:hypothetical protein